MTELSNTLKTASKTMREAEMAHAKAKKRCSVYLGKWTSVESSTCRVSTRKGKPSYGQARQPDLGYLA